MNRNRKAVIMFEMDQVLDVHALQYIGDEIFQLDSSVVLTGYAGETSPDFLSQVFQHRVCLEMI